MKPVLGSLGAHTLVILTAAESSRIQEALLWMEKTNGRSSGANALSAFRDGIKRGTAHMEAEFKSLQQAKKQGK